MNLKSMTLFWLLLLFLILPLNAVVAEPTDSDSSETQSSNAGKSDNSLVLADKVITIDLESLSFDKPLPFDEPFYISGDVSSDVKKVTLDYTVTKSKGFFGYTKPDDRKDEEYKTEWTRLKGSKATKFRLRVGPLHPNVDYRFMFKFIKGELSDEIKKKLKDIMIAELDKRSDAIKQQQLAIFTPQKSSLKDFSKSKTFFKLQNQLVNDYDSFAEEFSSQVELLLETESATLAKEDKINIIKNIKTKFGTYQNKYADQILKINLLKNDKDTKLEQINTGYKGIQSVKTTLEQVLNNPQMLSLESRENWNKQISEKTNDLTYARLGYLFYLQLISNQNFKYFLEGKKSITGERLGDDKGLNIDELDQLIRFQELMIDKQVFGTADPHTAAILSATEIQKLSAQTNLLEDYRETVKKLNELEKNHLNLKNDLSNDFLSIVYLEEVTVTGASRPVPISNDKSSYVGLDFGVAKVGGINDVLLYAGANIYLVPVNKDIPLSAYGGGDYWFRKRFSFLLGVTLSDFQDGDRNKPLFAGKGNMMLGAGYRITDIIKLNTGYLFFRQLKNDSINNEAKIEYEPFFSISFDADIKTLFTEFGDWLKKE